MDWIQEIADTHQAKLERQRLEREQENPESQRLVLRESQDLPPPPPPPPPAAAAPGEGTPGLIPWSAANVGESRTCGSVANHTPLRELQPTRDSEPLGWSDPNSMVADDERLAGIGVDALVASAAATGPKDEDDNSSFITNPYENVPPLAGVNLLVPLALQGIGSSQMAMNSSIGVLATQPLSEDTRQQGQGSSSEAGYAGPSNRHLNPIQRQSPQPTRPLMAFQTSEALRRADSSQRPRHLQ